MATIPRPLWQLPVSWIDAGINSLDAPRWRIWLAKTFGRRFTGSDGDTTLVGYEWRGKLYITDELKGE